MATLYTADQLHHPPPPADSMCCGGSTSTGTSSGNLSGEGSPLGVVTPTAQYQFYRDTLTDNYWWSNGLTSADWIAAI